MSRQVTLSAPLFTPIPTEKRVSLYRYVQINIRYLKASFLGDVFVPAIMNGWPPISYRYAIIIPKVSHPLDAWFNCLEGNTTSVASGQ